MPLRANSERLAPPQVHRGWETRILWRISAARLDGQSLHQPQRIHVHNQISARNLGGVGMRQHSAQRRIQRLA